MSTPSPEDAGIPTPARPPVVVAFGGGLNSAGMVVELIRRAEPIDLILMADTGRRDSEKPETYTFVDLFDEYLAASGYPKITWVRNSGMYGTLENNCLQKQTLPSLAYGFKSCSDKYKRRPQDQYVNRWQPARDAWARGEKVTKLLGIDVDEQRRATIVEDKKYRYQYPLIRWGWGREECAESLRQVGLPIPIKSACFFCPASKKSEVLWLAQTHPALFKRAVEMERNAAPNLQSVKGLGRRWSWEELVKAERPELLPDPPDIGCLCFDGEVHDEEDEIVVDPRLLRAGTQEATK